MTIGGAFLGGGVELVPAGSCKLVMEIRTEDGKNLATTFSVAGGGQTYTATAGADGRAEIIVPSGVTYTVTTSATGYDGLTAQTVIGDSATIQYVRFEAILPRVKKSGDTMTGSLSIPTPPSDAKGNEVTTADWVLGKLGSGALKKIDIETTITGGNLYLNNLQVGDIVVLNLKTSSHGAYSGAFTYTGTESQQMFGNKVGFYKPSSGTPYIESSYIWISNNGSTSVRLSCLYDKYVLGGTTYTSGTGNIHTPSGYILRG